MPLIDFELPSIAVRNIVQQKQRSYLTLSGIIIGIIIIVALLSIGQSMQKSIEIEFESMGMNSLFLEPGSEENMMTSAVARTIRESDIRLVESIPGVHEVIPFYEASGQLTRGKESTGVIILGIDPDQIHILERMGYLDVTVGRDVKKGDKYNMVIYEDFALNAFDEELKLREKVEVDEIPMRIIGISKPNSFMGFSFSNMIIITKAAARELFDAEDPVEVMITVSDKSRLTEVKEEIETVLEKAHGEKDFYIMSSEDMLASAGIVLNLVQIVLLGIASISIIVGGVGITNTMLMAVMERTREIGVMKAIGATNKVILSLFLTEAAMIGGVGGIIGIIIGLSLAFVASVLATMSGFAMPFIADPQTIIGVLLFSIIVGVIAGYVPAKRASDLDPVEALHYE